MSKKYESFTIVLEPETFTIDKKYTQNKAGNGLKTPEIMMDLVNHKANYILFEKNTIRYYFYIAGGIIQEIGYFSFPV